ncbi:ABC transporter substrate-binding protein [Phyllobacterium sp. 2063]|nr:ABC transporter substrate-binding protein [Phyllobacterium sp. 2063]MBZ9653747.1 ABC transporter substrate-binding protein [Phyllobacterium sp. 2063]
METKLAPVTLDVALRKQGHTDDLRDGVVKIRGVGLNHIDVQPAIAAYRRMVRDVEFDLCEMAPTTYYIARAHGAPFKALPIFLTRRFHHLGFVVRDDAGIRSPKDLEGKKVGVRAYSVTTGVWGRGILANEYGVDISKVTWVVDDEEHVQQLQLPDNVEHVPAGRSLASMMASGEIQAGFTANAGIGREGPPQPGWEAKKHTETTSYKELWPNGLELSAQWFRRTGIYPFHGLVVVKDSVLNAHPWIADELFRAFSQAKENWLKRLHAGEATSAEDLEYKHFSAIVGDDPLPYGIAENLPTIEALIDYSVQQKLMPRRLSVDELFVDAKA